MSYDDRSTVATVTIDISSITRDLSFQIRQGIDQKTVARYRDIYRGKPDVMPAVLLARHKGLLLLLDGWHRVTALGLNGNSQVKAQIVEVKTLEEARWFAAEANMRHGLPLTREEHIGLFQAYIKAGKHQRRRGEFKSYRDIENDLDSIRTHVTIRAWMQEYFPKIAERMAADKPKGHKGTRDTLDPQDILWATASHALDPLEIAIRGLTDEVRRSVLADRLKTALADLENGVCRIPDPPDF
jgi:hypothetical protein